MKSSKPKNLKLIYTSLVAGIIVIFLMVGVFFATTSQNESRTLRVNNTEINIEIATTSQEKERGLCCRDFLPENSGMLFMYDRPAQYRFWMKDTRIPLDMYWIDSKKKIIHIEAEVKPESYPKMFGPDAPAQYILETNAGFAQKHNISVGDSVSF